MDILIDYFRVTFKELELSDIIEYLGLENLNWLEGKARDGWSRHDYFNGIHLYSCGRDDVGIELSGVGCRTLESLNNLTFDWLTLFRWVVDLGDKANVSRLDVAGDEKDGILDFSTMVKHTRLGKYISKARKRIWIDGDEREIMWGASSSSTRLRIYDKALERGVDGHWIRAEFTVGGLPYNLQSLEDFIATQCASSIRAFIEVSSVDRLLDIVNHTPYSSKQKQLLSSLGVAVDA